LINTAQMMMNLIVTMLREVKMTEKLTRKQAADYMNRKPITLSMWASRVKRKVQNFERYDLPYYMVGGRAEYRKSDIDAFLIKYPSK
jgi:lysophospholipid acyltransferase (LPLAT)-like uncharacterized protein